MTTYNYNTIYAWKVFDKINEGKQVFMLDRQNQSVALLNDMDTESAVKIVNSEDNENRYQFWICEESEETQTL